MRAQVDEVSALVRQAYRAALEAADLTEVRAIPLAQTTLAGSQSATAEQILGALREASDSAYATFGALSTAQDALASYREELR